MYIIYLLTNKINNKKYIGKHKGELSDNYFGSGKLISSAFKKYGKESFKKTLLYECKNLTEVNLKEKEFIKLYNAVNDKTFYNLTSGGDGGNTLQYLSPDELEKRSQKIKKRLKEIYSKNKNNISRIKSIKMKEVRKNKRIETNRIKTLKETVSKYSTTEKTQIYKTRSGKYNYGSKKVKTPNGIFYTAKDAGIFHNVHTQTILNRCKNSKFKDWKFLNEKN